MLYNGRISIDWYNVKSLSDFVYNFKTTKREWEMYKQSANAKEVLLFFILLNR